MGQAEFTGMWRASAPQQRLQSNCGAAIEGALLLQLLDAMEMAGNGMDACDGERLFGGQGGSSRGS